MAYFAETGIKAVDSASIDAFGRWRSSDPLTLFDSTNVVDTSPLLWNTITNSGGAISHLPNEAAVQMTTGGTTSGAYCYRQTKHYFRYQPGKSQEIMITGVLGAAKANVRQRVGYFDTSNGIFFEQTNTDKRWVIRTNTSGSPSDASYATQAQWNIDKLDGTGPSGLTLNTANAQIFFIDFEWLGVGRVRVGFVIDGKIIYCHDFLHTNITDKVYMTTPHLPVRWEIENTGTPISATIMKQICVSIISEGGFDDVRGLEFSVNRGPSTLTLASLTRRAVLSIRPKATFNSIVNRSMIIPLSVDIGAGTNTGLFEIVYNPTFTTPGGLTWTSADSSSTVEYCIHGDAAAGAITGGMVLDSFYVQSGAAATKNTGRSNLGTKLPITLDHNGANPIALSIVGTSTSGNCLITAAMDWKEIY